MSMGDDGTMPMPMPMTPPPPGSMMMPDGGGGTMMMTMMRMSFYWGKDAIVLFSRWPNGSLEMYLLSLLLVLFLSAAVELLSISAKPKPEDPSNTNGSCSSRVVGAIGQAVVHGVRMGLAYLVMLSVMSFNVGILIAAVVGHTLGFFVVRARSSPTADKQYDTVPRV